MIPRLCPYVYKNFVRNYERAYISSECPYYTLDSSDPYFMFLEKNIKGPYILLVCIIINYYFGKWGGIKAYFAALSLSANVTFSINSVLHTFGYRNFYNDNSRNFILYLPLLMGDHLHNNHHKTCFCVNNRVKWYEFDPAYIIFCIFY